MKHAILTDLFLGLATLLALLGCVGMSLMRGAMARYHFVTMATLLVPVFALAAVLTEEGFSQTTLTASLIVAAVLVQGPVMAHLVARAVLAHERTSKNFRTKSAP